MNKNHEWFKQAKFGLMVHFGLYSLLAGEYRGKQMGKFIGEWIQPYFRIPNAEYEKLATAFNPLYFDADEWVSIAEDCGAKYLVVTSKHHEGFALFDSAADSFNSSWRWANTCRTSTPNIKSSTHVSTPTPTDSSRPSPASASLCSPPRGSRRRCSASSPRAACWPTAASPTGWRSGRATPCWATTEARPTPPSPTSSSRPPP